MPVKKTVSSKKRKEIHEAANSIPGLIIEHVTFADKENNPEQNKSKHKYMLSVEKQREHQKKRFTVFIGVGTVMLVLGVLWVFNIKTFFFDSKHTLSQEEELLGTVKQNFDNTVGLVTANADTLATSSRQEEVVSAEQLKAALIAGLLVSSTPATTSTSSTPPFTTTTTSTLNP